MDGFLTFEIDNNLIINFGESGLKCTTPYPKV